MFFLQCTKNKQHGDLYAFSNSGEDEDLRREVRSFLTCEIKSVGEVQNHVQFYLRCQDTLRLKEHRSWSGGKIEKEVFYRVVCENYGVLCQKKRVPISGLLLLED